MPGVRAKGLFQAKFWVERELWKSALSKAASERRSLSDVIREFLRGYVGEDRSPE